ncbi:putative aldolase class 2 protein RP493 [Pollicipes pollicipes]|uniref:putative aldolase class 2 protein RP493 n=1 Tax=Pollicipes pollicipes TaxID=41117 RepID=UPI0018855F17|nr:putative aldolase class 2 protein RP493 [Pollicipes pollicipes]
MAFALFKYGRAAVGATGRLQRHLSTAGAAAENAAVRRDLAASHRALDRLHLNEGICNHLSALAPARSGQGQVMLLAPFHQGFGEVTPESLLGLNLDGEVVEGVGQPELSAFSIHLGLRQSRPGPRTSCVFHTHMPYATALACLKDPRLRMVHQNSLRFHQRVSYDTEYAGLATALAEGQRLGRKLGDAAVLFMGNHGVLVVAETVAEAFDSTYYLERACMAQVMAQWTGQPLAEMSPEQCQQMAPVMQAAARELAGPHLDYVARQLARHDSLLSN